MSIAFHVARERLLSTNTLDTRPGVHGLAPPAPLSMRKAMWLLPSGLSLHAISWHCNDPSATLAAVAGVANPPLPSIVANVYKMKNRLSLQTPKSPRSEIPSPGGAKEHPACLIALILQRKNFVCKGLQKRTMAFKKSISLVSHFDEDSRDPNLADRSCDAR